MKGGDQMDPPRKKLPLKSPTLLALTLTLCFFQRYVVALFEISVLKEARINIKIPKIKLS